MALPFFVYGTLRPGEPNHDRFLRGRTSAEEPGLLRGAVLYDGPGYPYAVEEPGEAEPGEAESGGVVFGELVTALPDAYADLLRELDELEGYVPGDPRSLYTRVVRDVLRGPYGVPVRAWVYVAAPAVAERLRVGGTPVPGGNWHAARP